MHEGGSVGADVGADEGDIVGDREGAVVGLLDGIALADGDHVGIVDGRNVGTCVVGTLVGAVVGGRIAPFTFPSDIKTVFNFPKFNDPSPEAGSQPGAA